MSVGLPQFDGRARKRRWIRWLFLGLVGAAVAWALVVEFAGGPLTQRQRTFEPAAFALGLASVGVVGLFVRTRPIFTASVAVGSVALIHFLSFPGGGAGFALFALAFELGRCGTRTALATAAASPIAWMLLLALPPHAASLTSPALYGPAIGMLWTAVTGYAFGRARRKPDDATVSADSYRVEAGEDLVALLSPREKEIAELVAAGLDNTAIAQRLFISPVTVKSHVAHIMSKTGTTTRARLVAQIHQGHRFRDGV